MSHPFHPKEQPNNEQALSPNIKEAIEFLKLCHRDSQVHLMAFGENQRPKFQTFDTPDDPKIGVWIKKHNSNGYNICHHINKLNPSCCSRRAKKSDVTSSNVIIIDLDNPSEESFKKVMGYDNKPSLVVFSGNGWHFYWFLKSECTDLDRTEALGKNLADQFDADACYDRNRVLRVPGTINHPNRKKQIAGKVPVISFYGEEHSDPLLQYDIEELERSVQTPYNHGDRVIDDDHYDPPTVKMEDVGAARKDDWLGGMILSGDDPDNPRGSKNPRYPSRSEIAYAVACELARSNVSEDKIVGILINPNYKISESILEKPHPAKHALRTARKAISTVQGGWPICNKKGKPVKSYENAIIALLRLELVFEHDLFHNRKSMGGRAIQEFSGELTDDACAIVRRLCVERFGFDPGKQNLLDAVQTLCAENPVHPIREYLGVLEWDNCPRLETFLIDYFGAEDTPYARSVGKLMLIAAVRRVRQPGVKFDIMVVFEGVQGSGKSTALRILAGDENFSDQNVFVLNDRAQMEALQGVWIYEVAELDGMSRAEVSKVKAFISRTEDRGRPAYARFKENWKRQCILVGTTNEAFYLKDTTGNRRFLPIKTSEIDLGGLTTIRHQLWAEAAALEEGGYPIELPRELWEFAALEQEERTQEDPWTDILIRVTGTVKDGIERISTETLFNEAYLDVLPAQRKAYHPKRIAGIMRKLGWEGPKKVRVDGRLARGYERPSNASKTPDGGEF